MTKLTGWISMLSFMLLMVASPAFAQDADEKVDVEDGFYAVVVKLPAADTEFEVFDPNEFDPVTELTVGQRFPESTEVFTGDDCTIIFALETVTDGTAKRNSMISIRHNSEVLLDKMVLEQNSAVTRVKIKSGEVRVKVTEDRENYSTDMKVATPNATASVRGTDIVQLGFSATKGTYAAVASGSISAANNNGTTTNVGAGSSIDGGSSSALDKALKDSTQTIAPVGMVEYEVSVGQLSISGPNRPASDLNNPDTNPTSTRASSSAGAGATGRSDEVEPLP